MSVALEVVEDPAHACAAMMVGAASGGGHVVLTGGSTPRAAYEEFVRTTESVSLDLSQTHMWFGDERCVRPEDERSNFRMVQEAMLEPLGPLRSPKVHRMLGELGPEAGAEAYQRELLDAGPVEFDLLLLGMGPDGHVASLFPGQSTLGERERLVVGVPEAGLEPFVPRISFTLSTIGQARRVVLLISGESKGPAAARAFGAQAEPTRDVPASLVATVAAEVTVLLDPLAAAWL